MKHARWNRRLWRSCFKPSSLTVLGSRSRFYATQRESLPDIQGCSIAGTRVHNVHIPADSGTNGMITQCSTQIVLWKDYVDYCPRIVRKIFQETSACLCAQHIVHSYYGYIHTSYIHESSHMYVRHTSHTCTYTQVPVPAVHIHVYRYKRVVRSTGTPPWCLRLDIFIHSINFFK